MSNDYVSGYGFATNPAFTYQGSMAGESKAASAPISAGMYGGVPPQPPVPQMSLRGMMEQLRVVLDDHEKILTVFIQRLAEAWLVYDTAPPPQAQPGNVAGQALGFPVGRVLAEDVARVEQWTRALRQIHELLAL